VAIVLTHLDGPTPQQGESTVFIFMAKADPRTDGADGFRVVATARETGRQIGRWVSDCPLAAIQACMLWIQSEGWPSMNVAPRSPLNPNAVLTQTPGLLPLVPQGSDPNVNPARTPRLFFHLLAMNFPASALDPLPPPQLQQPAPERRQIAGPAPQQPQPGPAPRPGAAAPQAPQAPQPRRRRAPVQPQLPEVEGEDQQLRVETARGVSGAFRALREGADMATVRGLLSETMANLELDEDLDDDLDDDFDDDDDDFDDDVEDEEDGEEDLSELEGLDLDAIEAEVSQGAQAAALPTPATPAAPAPSARMVPPGSVQLDDGTMLLAVSLPRGFFQIEDGRMVRAVGPGRFSLMSSDEAAEAQALVERDVQEALRPLGSEELPPGLSPDEIARLEAMTDMGAAEKMRRTQQRSAAVIGRARRVAAAREAAPAPAPAPVAAPAPAPAAAPAPARKPHALPNDLVTLRHASEETGMSVSGLRKWVKHGKLTDYRSKSGGPRAVIHISMAEVHAEIQARRDAQAPGAPAAASR